MIDSLAVFYILLGLTFDIIGALFIISPIIAFKSKWTPELITLQSKWQTKLNEYLPELQKMFNPDKDEDAYQQFGKVNADFLKDSTMHRDNMNEIISGQKDEDAKGNAYSGISCLIGGFLLQGLGVVVQLF